MNTNVEYAVLGFSGCIGGDVVIDLEELIAHTAHLASCDGKRCFGKRAYAHHTETYPVTKRLKKFHMVWVWTLGAAKIAHASCASIFCRCVQGD